MRIACLQLQSTTDVAANVAAVINGIESAVAGGANFVATPEMTLYLGKDGTSMSEFARSQELADAIDQVSAAAATHSVWLSLGSIAWMEQPATSEKIRNRSLMFDSSGKQVAHYDKIHLFDANPGDGSNYAESRRYEAGEKAVVCQTPFGKVGLTVCYDLRFSSLYAALADAGCIGFTVPSAFTRPTGKAHWETLLRARAIEFGAFVIAASQCGIHGGGRKTWGHSMVVNPWGEIIATAGEEPETIFADINPEESDLAKRRIPCLANRRDFARP